MVVGTGGKSSEPKPASRCGVGGADIFGSCLRIYFAAVSSCGVREWTALRRKQRQRGLTRSLSGTAKSAREKQTALAASQAARRQMPRYQSWHREKTNYKRQGGAQPARRPRPIVASIHAKRSTKCPRLALPRRRRRKSNCVATRKRILRPSPSRNFQTAYLLREGRYAIGTSHATSRQSSSRCCCCRCWSS